MSTSGRINRLYTVIDIYKDHDHHRTDRRHDHQVNQKLNETAMESLNRGDSETQSHNAAEMLLFCLFKFCLSDTSWAPEEDSRLTSATDR